MKQCINDQCKNAIPDDAKHCPYCGQNQVATRTFAQPFFIIGTVMLFLMVVLLVREISFRPVPNEFVDHPFNKSILTSTQAPTATNRITSAPPTPLPSTRTAIPFTNTNTPAIPPTPTIISTSTTCRGAPSTRVAINDLVRVVTTDNDRLVLRAVPEIDKDNELQRLNKGTELKIFNGPVCVKDPATSISYWFWYVRIKSTNIFGWVAEGDRSLYYLK